MRILNAAVGAVLLLLAASPALAGDPRGGGHQGGGCGSRCGGGHTPPPPPPCCGGGGYTGNINVNVNANANASAQAYAGASAGGYFNARAYDVGAVRGRGYGGGTVYVGGGYGGDGGGYYGGGAIYNEEVYEGRVCASAPFGYVVGGFGRNDRRTPACVANSGGCRDDSDRGGRYGYSERHGCGGGRRESYEAYEESSSYEESSYESRESYREYEGYSGGYEEVGYGSGGYSSGGGDCGCDHDEGRDYAPYPPRYLPDPAPPVRPRPPHRPRPSHPPRQSYSQEPGERG